ncbi:MAG: tripartite tricarboxylate transporter TctB family protein [Chromatiales bacterium]|nr:tripartite tricarboxylate transporter TctB family protein [Chromatiales bacterium]
MRAAELVMAILMGLASIGLMVKSAELPVGWIDGEGPGGGAFPFWLAFGMLVCCVWIVVNWARRKTPPSRSDQPYLDREGMLLVVTAGGSLAVMIGLIHVVGVYFSVPLFLLFYLRFVGNHRWSLTTAIAVSVPIVTFFFFEIALRITLPKGYSEPLFYPLYDWFL